MRSDPPGQPSTMSSTASTFKRIEPKVSDLPEWQATLISMIIHNIKSNYLFPKEINEQKLRSEMTSEFRMRFSNPEYASEDGIADKKQFAQDVTLIIRNIMHDNHIYLSLEEKKILDNKADIETIKKFPWDCGLNDDKIISPEERRINEENFTHDGCGFHGPRGIDAVEGRIPPNVGYIGIDYVADTEAFLTAREKVFEAMLKVQEKEAIIIDLRNNRGGSPDGMLYFLSFFFQENTHINTYDKFENGIKKEEKKFETWKRDKLNPDPGGKFKGMDPPDLSKKDIYILINEETISAGEAIAYHMKQCQKLRGPTTIIGMPSVGSAHPSGPRPLLDPNGDKAKFNKYFTLAVPSVNDRNSQTNTNWEDVNKGKDIKGVQPDHPIRDTKYELTSWTDDKPEKGKFYVRYENNTLEYKVINPDGKEVHSQIDKAELDPILEASLPPGGLNILQPLNLEKLKPCLPRIIDATSGKGEDALTQAVKEIQEPKLTNNREFKL